MQVQNPSRPARAALHPLNTAPTYPERRMFVTPVYRSPGPNTPSSATSLASPTLAGVRQYYRDHGLTTALQNTPVARRPSAPVSQMLPRRHSSISSPGGLAARLGRVAVSSPLSITQQTQQPEARPRYQSIAETSRNQLLAGISESERATLGRVVDRRRTSVQPDMITQPVSREPADDTHRRLRHWGPAYLGNIGTSDVLVRAMHLVQPVMKGPPSSTNSNIHGVRDMVSISSDATKSGAEIVVRARVTPSTKDRKPFLIQRRFDLDVMRAKDSLPAKVIIDLSESDEGEEFEAAHQKHVRSQSTPVPHPTQALPLIDTRAKSSLPRSRAGTQKRCVPIRELCWQP